MNLVAMWLTCVKYICDKGDYGSYFEVTEVIFRSLKCVYVKRKFRNIKKEKNFIFYFLDLIYHKLKLELKI